MMINVYRLSPAEAQRVKEEYHDFLRDGPPYKDRNGAKLRERDERQMHALARRSRGDA